MRFPLAALFFLIGSFVFFVVFVVSSLLLGTVGDALQPFVDELNDPTLSE